MLIGHDIRRQGAQGAIRGTLVAAMSLSLLAVPAVTATAIAAAAPAAEEAPLNERAPRPVPEKPGANERAPRVPDPPDLGDTPWASPEARDLIGYRLSTYAGKYYMKSWEQFRLCVLERESNGYYTESSAAHTGGYQMTSALKYEAVERLRPEMKKLYGDAGVAALEKIKDQPLHAWNRFWQDAAFWAVLNGGAGWGHWHWKWGGRWVCLPGAHKESGWPKNGSIERGTQERTTGSFATPRATPSANQRLARDFIRKEYGWGKRQFSALKDMWWKESNWRHTVINWQGPWYGLGQVNGGFIASQGYSVKEYMASPLAQIDVGAAYIKQRYGNPVKAWAAWMARYNQNGAGWY